MMAHERKIRFTGEKIQNMTDEQKAKELVEIRERKAARRRKQIERRQIRAFWLYLLKGIAVCFVCYIVWCFILWVFGVSYM